MPNLDESFARLLGRQPSDVERQRLFEVRDALGLGNNDALWLVLMALEHYRVLYEQIPGEVRKASEAAVVDVRSSATAAAAAATKAAADQAKQDFARAMAKAVAQVARGTSHRQLLQWALAVVLVVSALVGGVGWWSYRAGVGSTVEGARARAAWTDSAEGRLAYELSKVGSLRVLARCEAPGWEVQGGKCYPEPLEGHRVFGWAIPSGIPEKHKASSR